MSNEALTLVSKAAIRPSGRKFVAMALADYADESWQCFPSIKTLAEYTAQGQKTVRDHLDALEAEKIIARHRPARPDGKLAGYRYEIQWRNLPVAKSASGEKPPKPVAKSATQEPPDLTPSTNNGKARAKPIPLPEDWAPRQAERELAEKLGFTPEEFDHAEGEFRDFWGDRSRLKGGRKSNWDRTFGNRLYELAQRWGTVRRKASGAKPGGQRRGGSSLADAAARLLSEAEQGIPEG